MKDHLISVDKARYATSIVANYLDVATVKTCKYFYQNTFPSNIIFTKTVASTSDEKVENLTWAFNHHCFFVIYNSGFEF